MLRSIAERLKFLWSAPVGFSVAGVLAIVLAIAVPCLIRESAQPEPKTEMTLLVRECSEITVQETDFQILAIYKGHAVSDLWRVRLELANTGNQYIVGRGQTADILTEGIDIAFPEGTQIIGPFTISMDNWLHAMPENFSVPYPLPALNIFRAEFDQWAPGEAVSIVCYVGSQEALAQAPMPAPGTQILRGEWKVEDLRPTESG